MGKQFEKNQKTTVNQLKNIEKHINNAAYDNQYGAMLVIESDIVDFIDKAVLRKTS